MPDALEKLIAHFERLPGVGPRQASRFAYALLNAPKGVLLDFGAALQALPDVVKQCPTCGLFHGEHACKYCENKNRDATLLMVVAKDTDVVSMERTGLFKGYYIILGGVLPVVGEGSIREGLLTKALGLRPNLKEVIIALPATPEGDITSDKVKGIIKSVTPSVAITLLGRGLSTGTELEYSDKETLRSALQNRK